MTAEHRTSSRRHHRFLTIGGDSRDSGIAGAETSLGRGRCAPVGHLHQARGGGAVAAALLVLAALFFFAWPGRTFAETAASRAGIPGREATPARRGISGVVRIAPALVSRVETGDTLFVFARAADGDETPLAILRKPAHELPAAFFLDDSTAINMARRPSVQNELVIGARISRRGSAAVIVRGDLQGFSGPVRYGEAGVVIVIDSEVK